VQCRVCNLLIACVLSGPLYNVKISRFGDHGELSVFLSLTIGKAVLFDFPKFRYSSSAQRCWVICVSWKSTHLRHMLLKAVNDCPRRWHTVQNISSPCNAVVSLWTPRRSVPSRLRFTSRHGCDFAHSFYIFIPFGQNSIQKIFTKILSAIVEFPTNGQSQAHFVLSAVNKIPFTVQCGCSPVQVLCTKCSSAFGSFFKIGIANPALSL